MSFDRSDVDDYQSTDDALNDLMSSDDLVRWGSLATAAFVMAYGASRRSTAGIALAAAAMPLAYRGLVGQWPTRDAIMKFNGRNGNAETALAGEKGVHVRESIRLEKPLEEVYRFWRQLENLPRFMSHLERVTQIDSRRSHWVARGPVHLPLEWDAEIINEVENRVIGWRSLPGADVVTAGSVNFDSVRSGRGTQLSLHLQYAAPGGRVSTALASMIGQDPARLIREDLRRLKQLLEAGEVSRATGQTEPVSEGWR